MSQTYEQLVTRIERDKFEKALNMETGYLLDLTDHSFDRFFIDTVGIDPQVDTHLFRGRGHSKAKKFRAFLENASPDQAVKILQELWSRRSTRGKSPNVRIERELEQSFRNVIARIEARDSIAM